LVSLSRLIPKVAEKLQPLYGTVDNIDLWVGGLAEDHIEASSMGERTGWATTSNAR